MSLSPFLLKHRWSLPLQFDFITLDRGNSFFFNVVTRNGESWLFTAEIFTFQYVVSITSILFQYISNKMQRHTVYYIWKLLYMFRVVPPPITRSANNCIYSIWHLSHRYCSAVPTLQRQRQVAVNGVRNNRCCRYSCLRSWWWVEVSPETCRAVSR